MAESGARHTVQGEGAALRWLGTHAVIGVPARDLSAAEAARHAAAIAAAEKAHGHPLYAPAAAPAPVAEKKEK